MFGQKYVCNIYCTVHATHQLFVSIFKHVLGKLSVNLSSSNEVKSNVTRFMTSRLCHRNLVAYGSRVTYGPVAPIRSNFVKYGKTTWRNEEAANYRINLFTLIFTSWKKTKGGASPSGHECHFSAIPPPQKKKLGLQFADLELQIPPTLFKTNGFRCRVFFLGGLFLKMHGGQTNQQLSTNIHVLQH